MYASRELNDGGKGLARPSPPLPPSLSSLPPSSLAPRPSPRSLDSFVFAKYHSLEMALKVASLLTVAEMFPWGSEVAT